jgi:putative membrane protein
MRDPSIMSKTRKPQVLELTAVEVENEAPLFAEPLDEGQPQTASAPRGFRWLALFGSAFAGLILLGATLWAENFVRTLLERQPALGWVALGLLILVALGLIGFIAKETRAIMRLEKLDDLRDSFQKAYDEDDTTAARKALDQVTAIYRGHPNTAQGRATFEQQRVGVLDAQDLIVIAEESLMAPLDREAVRLVSTSARRVSLVTALSPRALVDIAMVVFQCVTLTRQIAQLYGARPGFFGALKLGRHMMAHLAITGGIAATEGLVSQVLGHSLAARLSTRLGEGVINGLLTARVGIAAIAVTRPMPHIAGNGPTLSEVTRGIAGLGGSTGAKKDET